MKMKEIIGEYLKQFNSKNTKNMYEVHLNQYFRIIDTDHIYGNGIDIDNNGWKKNILGHTVVWTKEIANNRRCVKFFFR